MKYMLDTNIIVYAKNNRLAGVFERFMEYDPSELSVSAITMAELEYGVQRSSRPWQNQLALMLFLSRIAILPFDDMAAREYGVIRAELARIGQPIGGNDLLIAAHAKALGLTLITNNMREFARVAGLKVENWV